MTSIWHIQEGFSLRLSGEFLSINYGGDTVISHIDEIDDLIDALKRARSQIQIDQQKAREEEALARWGKVRRRVSE